MLVIRVHLERVYHRKHLQVPKLPAWQARLCGEKAVIKAVSGSGAWDIACTGFSKPEGTTGVSTENRTGLRYLIGDILYLSSDFVK